MIERAPVSVSDIASPNPPVGGAKAAGLDGLLSPQRVACGLAVSSRKRLFEELARLISSAAGPLDRFPPGAAALDRGRVFDILHERERLGSTAVGRGIALPHGRMPGLRGPIVAAARLARPIDYDAPDGEAVWLAVCLLVPAEANAAHLHLLASLAARFLSLIHI